MRGKLYKGSDEEAYDFDIEALIGRECPSMSFTNHRTRSQDLCRDRRRLRHCRKE
jgi:hypothetical protein